MSIKKCVLFFLFFCVFLNDLNAQSSDPLAAASSYDARRGAIVFITEGILYTVSMAGLSYLWYRKYPRSGFHFFNDNGEWLQMDKVGHATTAYNIGLLGIGVLKWTGMNRTNAIWWGGMTGLLFQTSIEVMDGFSANWGFSKGDMIANMTGTALVMSQALAWNEQRFSIQFSFHETLFENYRPEAFGTNYIQKLLKDYNGQTYWLSCRVGSFLPASLNFPKWLSLDAGYGADGMLGGSDNPSQVNGVAVPQFERVRKFFLSLDVSLPAIQTSPLLNTTFNTINFIKIPSPAFEFDYKGFERFYPLYY